MNTLTDVREFKNISKPLMMFNRVKTYVERCYGYMASLIYTATRSDKHSAHIGVPVPALRMSVDTHRSSDFQGERGYFL